MAKRRSNPPVVIDKGKFLLPKMEFFPLDEATGEGVFIRELGGKSLLEFKELVEKMNKEAGDGNETSLLQDVELMVFLVSKTACNADGTLYLTEDDVVMLAEKSPSLLLEMSNKATELSGMDTEATKTLPNAPTVSSSTS